MYFPRFRNLLQARSWTRTRKRTPRPKPRYRPAFLTLEDRVVPSTITWDNRGQTSDGFAAVFGANANVARSDVDAALADWANLISNFNYSNGTNTFHITISVGGTGFGSSTSFGAQLNGKPTSGSISIGGGSDGHGAGYFLDPTPSNDEEFQGTIINPYALSATPMGPADGKRDLYTTVTTTFSVAAGINDAPNELFTSDPNHYLTNTGHADALCPGTLWTYHGPDVDALFTSDAGCSASHASAVRIALPDAGNQVTAGGVTYFGAADVGTPLAIPGQRYLPSNLDAQILHDSYGYTVNPPTGHSAYVDYNPTTHNVLVRDGSHGAAKYPSQNNPSNDTITISTFSIPAPPFLTYIQFDVQIGNPTPGTGPSPTYSEAFLANTVSSITLNTTDGADTISLQNTFALFAAIAPITVNLGSGTPTVNILNITNPGAVTVNLGNGNATVNLQQTLAPVTVNGGTGTSTVNVLANAAPVTLNLGAATSTVNLGSNGSVQGIQAAVTVENPTNHSNVINVDDSVDSAAHSNVILDSFTPAGDTLFGRISNLAPAVISYEFADTRALNVKTGMGTTVLNVQATGAGTTNLSSNGPTTVNFGNANSLTGVAGAVVLENEISSDTVVINDQNDTGFRTASLATVIQRGATLGRLSGLAAGTIAWDYPDTTQVTINTGQGGVHLAVQDIGGVRTLINGNSLGTNTLVGPGVVDTPWTVNGANAGNLGIGPVNAIFSGFQNLTSGSGEDGFNFGNGATLSGTLDGGGSSGLSMAAYAANVNLTVNVTSRFAGNVPGVVGHFMGIDGVSTGGGNDRFVFSNGASLVGIDGGGGTNTLDASAVTSNLTVLVSGAQGNAGYAFGVTDFGDIQNITLGSGNDTVVFNDGASLAGMLDTGGGTNTLDLSPYQTSLASAITAANGGSVAGVLGAFANVENVIGPGVGGNDFAFADGGSLAGVLDGGVGGNNTLDYTTGWSGNVLVNLQTGAASGLAPGHLADIQNVLGASGGGAGFYDILVGNGGNYLQGGFGRRNLLVAGGSASTLIGGDNDDILIGGTTAYDGEADMHSFVAIMSYWAGTTDDYFTRVNNLTTGNGVPLLDASTVFNNGGGNTLLGNNGGAAEMNLFYGLDPSLENTDYNPGIGEVFINV